MVIIQSHIKFKLPKGHVLNDLATVASWLHPETEWIPKSPLGPQLPIHPRWMEYPQSDLKPKGIAVRIIVITAIILALMFVCFPALRSVWSLWFRRQAEICHALVMVVEKTVVIMIAAKAGLLKPCVFSTSTIYRPFLGGFPAEEEAKV